MKILPLAVESSGPCTSRLNNLKKGRVKKFFTIESTLPITTLHSIKKDEVKTVARAPCKSLLRKQISPGAKKQ